MISQINPVVTVLDLAKRSPNREICGAIDSDGKVIPLRNTSKTPDTFVFHKGDWFSLLNSGVRIQCLYHSHIAGTPDPSPLDLESQKKHKFDLLIVTSDDWRYIPYES